MKKTIVILAIVLGFTTFVNAQFKPTSGFDAEVNFSPFSATPISIDYLKLRMFLNESMAVRLGFNFNIANQTDKTSYGTPTSPVIQEAKSSAFTFGLHPGIEFHMTGTDRLSPYCGAELNITMRSASTDVTNVGGTSGKTSKYDGVWMNGSNNAYTMVGLNLFCGTDFYVAKHLYIGAEFGFGFGSASYKDQVYSVSTSTTNVTTPGGSSSSLGFNYNSYIRLGWSFE